MYQMKSKKLVLILIIQLCFQVIFANSDSLLSSFDNEVNSKERIRLAYEYALVTIISQPDNARDVLQLALRDSAGYSDYDSLFFCLNALSVYHFYNSNFDSCIFFAEKAIEGFLKSNSLDKIDRPRKNIALARRSMGQYDLALEEFFIILENLRQQDEKVQIAAMLNDIGNTYNYLEDYEKGNTYQYEGLAIAKEINNVRLLGNILNSLGYAYGKLGKVDSAIIYYEESLVYKIKGGNIYSIIATRNNICSRIDFEEYPIKCEDCFNKLIEEQKKINDQLGLARSYINLAVMYSFHSRCKQAIDCFDSTGFYLIDNDDIFLKRKYFKLYAKTLSKCGNYKLSNNYLDSLLMTNDSIFAIEKRKELLELDTKYQTKQKEENIRVLEAVNSNNQLKLKNQQLQNLILFLVIIIILVSGLIYYYMLRQKQKKEKELAILRMREEERVRIARDMHDEIGSGLTRISLASEQIQIAGKVNAEEDGNLVSSIKKQSKDLSASLKEIIWAIDPSNDSLEEMIYYCRDYAYDFSTNTGIECVVDFPEDIPNHDISSEIRRNLFLIIKESLNNISKYSKAKKVILVMELLGSFLDLTIVDDGLGFNKEEIKKGVGLLSMQARAEGLGGSFSIDSEIDKGTILKVTNIRIYTT